MDNSVELFSIVCDSCTARLRVKQESLIGQILACPRCSSMVKVEAPEGWISNSSTALDSSNSVQGKPASARKAAKAPDANRATEDSSFDEIDALLAGKTVRQPIAQKASVAHAAPRQTKTVRPAATGAASSATDQPLVPNNQWMGQQTKHRQKWLLLIFGALAILVTSSILVVALLSSLFAPNSISDADSKADSNEGTEKLANNSTDVESTLNKNGTDDSTAKNSPAKNSVAENTTAKTTAAETSKTNAAENKNDSNKIDDTATDVASGSSDAVPDKVPDSLPLDTIVDNGSPNTPLGTDIPKPDDGIGQFAEQPKSALDGMGFIQELLEDDGGNVSILEQMRSDQRVEQSGMSRFYVAYPDPLEIDIPKQMAMLIHGLKTETTIRGVADYLFMISRVPVTIDAESVVALGINPLQKLNIFESELSTEELINKVFGPLGFELKTTQTGGVLLVSKHGEFQQKSFDIPASTEYSDEDFAGMVASIKYAFGQGTWDLPEGANAEIVDKQLVCRQQPHVLWQIEDLFKKLNAAYEFKNDKTNMVAQQKTRSSFEHWLRLNEIKLKTGWVLPQKLSTISEDLEKNYGVTLLIDWENLASQGWNPDAEVPWLPEDRSIITMMNDLAHAMKLEWKIVDENLILLTTRSMYTKQQDVEVFPLSSYPNIKFDSEQLNNMVQGQLSASVGSVQGAVVAYHPKYDCFIAVMPQDLQFQLARSLRRLNGDE